MLRLNKKIISQTVYFEAVNGCEEKSEISIEEMHKLCYIKLVLFKALVEWISLLDIFETAENLDSTKWWQNT